MFVYIPAFICSLLFVSIIDSKKYLLSKSAKFLIYAIAFLPLFLVAALRYNVGTDYSNYFNLYTVYYETLDEVWESGFLLLCRFVHILDLNFQWIMVISAFIILTCTFKFIERYSVNRFFSLLMFICMAYYFQGLNIVRQWLALGIILFNFDFILKRNTKMFILICIIASSFHKSALIFIPLYLILQIRFKLWHYVAAAIFLAVPLYFREYSLQLVLNLFYSSKYENSPYLFFNFDMKYVVFYAGIVLLCVRHYKTLLVESKENIVFINISVAILYLYMFCGWLPLITRIIDMLAPIEIVFLPKLISCEKEVFTRKILFLIFVTFYIFVFFYLTLELNFHDVLPYQSILNKK